VTAVSNAEVARRGLEAALRGEMETIAELLDPDVKWHGGDPSSGCQNRDEALVFIRRAVEGGNIASLVDVVDAGDRVVVIMQPAAQEQPVANLTTFRDGKVVEMVHYADPQEALAACKLPSE
jgi:ketosteroid isomerase-like protein